MTAKQTEKHFKKGGKTKSVSAVSPVISTIIISSTLLIILVIASFVSTNILELRLADTEFEQAKTNMLLLNKIIQDVALKEDAASSMQFSQRSGGIGIYESAEKINITLIQGSQIDVYPFSQSDSFYIIKYRGGSRVSAAETNLTGSSSLVVGMSEPLGYVRVEIDNGVWIVLDYLRVRVVTNTILRVGGINYNLTEIFIIRLELGSTSGSGTVTVKVQNMGFRTQTYYPANGATLRIKVGERSEELTLTGSNLVLRVTEALIRVSIS
ncbi:hypothetical protein J7L29_04360 [Candidatus Bathyarchaeota archaeon]|nr:hypothetical protein [Candidatus Bathyarchaeota archaeon]